MPRSAFTVLAVAVILLGAGRAVSAADRYVLAYWYEVGGFQNACCGGVCSCSGTGNHSVYIHVLDADGNKLGNIRVEDADNPAKFGITNDNPADKFGFAEIPLFINDTPRMTVNDAGLASDVTPEMIENRSPTNGHYSWECGFMRVPDTVTVTFDQALIGIPNLSGGGCDIHAPFTASCAFYDLDPYNWASDDFSLDTGAASYGQTFVATGDRVVIAKFQTTVGGGIDMRYGVTIRANGPGGAILGSQAQSRLMKSDEYFTQIVRWPLSGPDTCIVTPGSTYYAEIVRTDQAGGINLWRRDSNVYPGGQMYRAGSAVGSYDLMGRIICATVNPGPTGTLAGTVRNATAQPLVSADVVTQPGNYATATDGNGAYTLANVPVGTYSVTASKTGYDSATRTDVLVTESATTTENFTLTATPTAPGTVSGTVRDLSAVPIGLAHVTLTAGSTQYGAVTESDGTYQIADVPPGTHDVTAYARRRPGRPTPARFSRPPEASSSISISPLRARSPTSSTTSTGTTSSTATRWRRASSSSSTITSTSPKGRRPIPSVCCPPTPEPTSRRSCNSR